MLGSALDFPTAGDDGPRAVLVGGGLLLLATVTGALAVFFPPLLGVSLLALLLVRGYHLRALRVATGGGDAPPAFERWSDLVVDGLTATLVHLLYLLPALAFGAVALAGNLSGGLVARPGALLSALQTVAGFGVLFLLLYLVGAAYVMPAAVANVAYEGRFGAAFEFRRIASGAFSEDYAVAWILAGLLQLVVFPVALALQTLLVGFFLQFLVAVAARYVYGKGFAAALGLEALSETERAAGPDHGPTGAHRDAAEPVVPAIRPVERSTAATPPDDSDDSDEGRRPGDGDEPGEEADPLFEEAEWRREG